MYPGFNYSAHPLGLFSSLGGPGLASCQPPPPGLELRTMFNFIILPPSLIFNLIGGYLKIFTGPKNNIRQSNGPEAGYGHIF